MSAPAYLSILAVLILALPSAALVWLGVRLLVRRPPSERTTGIVTSAALGGAFVAALAVGSGMFLQGQHRVVVPLGAWFSVPTYQFDLALLIDRLSLPFVVLTLVLSGVVGRFSSTYLHRDPGHDRFFLLLLLFASGMLLLVMAGTIDLLYGGWELVGLASALLIAFFQERREPVLNGLRTFAVYKFCDVGLLTAAVLLHHHGQTADFTAVFGGAEWPGGAARLGPEAVQIIGLLLLLAAIGKSAQLPFCGWLPRAMEGPTPSSAIFYGGISIHAGAYLLLRAAPLFEGSPAVTWTIIGVGAATAIYATLIGRAQSDAKTQLAYSAMAQVGLIFVEIGAGLRFLALIHIAGHASIRTLQFLRSPSVLHDFHRIHAASGGELSGVGLYYEMLIPTRVRRWLYAFAIQRGALESLLHRTLVRPLMLIFTKIEALERSWTGSAPVSKEATEPNVSYTSADLKKRRIEP